MRTFIIAEAGVNHNGSLEIAKKLIDVSSLAGADAVKFQTFRASKLLTASAEKVRYQLENTGTNEPQLEMLEKLELSSEMHRELLSYCQKKNIIFMSTPFDEASVDLLDNLGMEIFKISSGEITNKPLIQHVASKKKHVFLSTGMSYLGEVEKAIGWIDDIWNKLDKRPQLTILHCVSNYPAKTEDVNLNALRTMGMAFGLPVGYSDHTMGIDVAIAAVAVGARVIEKHFTLARDMKGPDHKASIEPNELKDMVHAIRNIEKAMGDGIKKPAKSEISTKKIARRSLVAARDIKAGKSLLSEDILIKRPGIGIPAEFKDKIVGMQLERDISVDSIIRWEDLKRA